MRINNMVSGLPGRLLHALATLSIVLLGCPGAGASGLPAIVHHIIEHEPVMQLAALQQVSDSDEFLIRSYKSPAHRRAAQQIEQWMKLAGMVTWQDAIGNVHGELRGANSSESALMMGSHYDTVKDAGAFDGPLGIITAIAAVKALVATSPQCTPRIDSASQGPGFRGFGLFQMVAAGSSGEVAAGGGAGTRVRVGEVQDAAALRDVRPCMAAFLAGPGRNAHLRVVAFTDEEGVRFQSTFLGSRALAGSLSKELLETRDLQGVTVAQTLEVSGSAATTRDVVATTRGAARSNGVLQQVVEGMQLPRGGVHAYVEAHMEQGPALEALGEAVGVVSAIAGQSRWAVSVGGEQGHAGTVPMHLRKDPMPVAGLLMHAISERCRLPRARPDSGIMHAMHTAFQRLSSAAPGWLQRAASITFSKLPVSIAAWLEGLGSGVAASLPAPTAPYLVCTVGAVDVWPGASNVVPKTVNFTVDIRSDDDDARAAVEEWLQDAVATACDTAHLPACAATRRHAAGGVQSSERLTEELVASVERALRTHAMRGFADPASECMPIVHAELTSSETREESGLGAGFTTSQGGGEARDTCEVEGASKVAQMTSGAGHDAMVMAQVAPVAMLFVRCRAGLAHSPEEFVAPADVIVATRVLLELAMRDSGMY